MGCETEGVGLSAEDEALLLRLESMSDAEARAAMERLLGPPDPPCKDGSPASTSPDPDHDYHQLCEMARRAKEEKARRRAQG